MTTFFVILGCEDTKTRLLSRLYGAIFQFYVDPHHRVKSDALHIYNNKSGYFEHYLGMQVQVRTINIR